MYLILIPFFEPSLFIQNNMIDQLYFIGSLVGMSWAILFLLQKGHYTKKSNFFPLLTILGMNIALGISTFVNGGDKTYNLKKLILDIGYLLIVGILIRKNLYDFTDTILNIWIVIALINMWSLFSFYETGMFTGDDGMIQYFWSVDNHFVSLLISMVFMAFYKDAVFRKNKTSIKSIVVLGIAVATLVKAWSATSLIGMTIFLSGLIIQKSGMKLPEFIKKRFLIFFAIVINLSVVLYNSQEHFSGLLNFLGKDATLSLRTRIWEYALTIISTHTLLGLGSPGAFGIGGWFYHPFQGNLFMHNEFLELWVDGGIFAVIFFILFLMGPLLLRKKYRRDNTSTLLVSFLAACYIMMVTETLTPRNRIFAVIMITYYEYTRDQHKEVLIHNER